MFAITLALSLGCFVAGVFLGAALFTGSCIVNVDQEAEGG